MEGDVRVGELVVRYNELTAEEFISLWKTVWEGAPPEFDTLIFPV